jgi:hypothetical protein
MVSEVYPKSFPAEISDLVHAVLEVQMEEGHCFLGRSVDVMLMLKQYRWWMTLNYPMKRGRR